MADTGYYQARLKSLLDDPSSFAKSPGYQFAVDESLNAAKRSGSAMRGSGNVLAELARRGAGLASQEYGAQVDRMGRLLGQEQQYDLGQGQNRNAATRNANDFSLGTMVADNARRRNEQDFGIGMGQLAGQNWQRGADYDLGRRRIDIEERAQDASSGVNWFNAVTNRGRTAGDLFYQGEDSNRKWYDRFF